jgi:DNA-binding beta-propeller fold protein YncE
VKSRLLPLALLVACGGGGEGDPCAAGPGTICTFAGTGVAALGRENVPAIDSPLYLPQDLTFGPDGRAYLQDWNNHRIRAIDAEGIVETVAGSGFLGDGPEGDAMLAMFNHPTNIAFDSAGGLVLAAWHNSRIERIDLGTSTLSFVAGTGARGYNETDIDAKAAILDLPSSVVIDEDDNIWFSDQANQQIRMVGADGILRDVGGQQRVAGYLGDGGPVAEAMFHASVGQAADPSNRLALDGRTMYVADTGNHLVRVLDLDSLQIDRFAGTPPDCDETGTKCVADNYGSEGDGGDALAARLFGPTDVAVGPDHEVYIADTGNHCVRVVRDGAIETFAGTCGEFGYDGDGGAATDALLERPYGVALDADGNVFIGDTYNNVFRKVTR